MKKREFKFDEKESFSTEEVKTLLGQHDKFVSNQYENEIKTSNAKQKLINKGLNEKHVNLALSNIEITDDSEEKDIIKNGETFIKENITVKKEIILKSGSTKAQEAEEEDEDQYSNL